MRYKFVIFIFFAFWAVMIIRLYHVSIQSNFYYEKLAHKNMERVESIKPIRGVIYDKNKNLLAMNNMGFAVYVSPHLNKIKLDKVFDTIFTYLPEQNRKKMHKLYRKYNSPYNHKNIKVIDFIDYSDMVAVYPKMSLEKNIYIESNSKRYYPYGEHASHIIGYIGRSNNKENNKDDVVNEIGKIGKEGIEKYYNKLLQGDLGEKVSKVNAKNKAVETLKYIPPTENRDITLNIDIELQEMIHKKFGSQTGVAIVMKTNGDLLAAVSTPSYDPNLFVGGISTKEWKKLQNNLDKPFMNKIARGQYPPGSAIKMGMILSFSNSKPSTLLHNEECKGHITVGKRDFRCWASWGHGDVSLKRAIKESCDVYFYNKSLKVGINEMAKTLETYGFGEKTGIDLPWEKRGILPSKMWKAKRHNQPWYIGDTLNASIGQGYNLATPIQVARYTAMLATSKLPTPRLASTIDGKVIEPTYKFIEFNKEHIKEVRRGMHAVCNEKYGTAYKALHKLPITVAGKTGTSQVASIPQKVKKRLKEHELAYRMRSHAWLTTYAPYKDPKYIVTMIVEHGGHGGTAAGPIVADIYEWLYEKGYFREDLK